MRHGVDSVLIKALFVQESPSQPCTLLSQVDRKGIQIIAAFTSGESAIHADLWNKISVLITGLRLSGMPGVELIQWVKKVAPHVKCLVYTTEVSRPHVGAALRAGASGYVLQDCSEMELQTAIDAMMAGGCPMSPKVSKVLVDKFLKATSEKEIPLLSDREVNILQLLSQSLLYKEVAEMLGVSPHTVHSHIKKIYKKLNANNRWQAVQSARKLGTIS